MKSGSPMCKCSKLLFVFILSAWILVSEGFSAELTRSLTMDFRQIYDYYNNLGGRTIHTYIFGNGIREGAESIEMPFHLSFGTCGTSYIEGTATFHFDDRFTKEQEKENNRVIGISGFFPEYSDVEYLDRHQPQFFHCEITDILPKRYSDETIDFRAGILESDEIGDFLVHGLVLQTKDGTTPAQIVFLQDVEDTEDLIRGILMDGHNLQTENMKDGTDPALIDFMQDAKDTEDLIRGIIEDQRKGTDQTKNLAMAEYAKQCQPITIEELMQDPQKLVGKDYMISGLVSINDKYEEELHIEYSSLEKQLLNMDVLLVVSSDTGQTDPGRQLCVRILSGENVARKSSILAIMPYNDCGSPLELYDAWHDGEHITIYGKCMWVKDEMPEIYPVFFKVKSD